MNQCLPRTEVERRAEGGVPGQRRRSGCGRGHDPWGDGRNRRIGKVGEQVVEPVRRRDAIAVEEGDDVRAVDSLQAAVAGSGGTAVVRPLHEPGPMAGHDLRHCLAVDRAVVDDDDCVAAAE
jgi:hypothetical protein